MEEHTPEELRAYLHECIERREFYAREARRTEEKLRCLVRQMTRQIRAQPVADPPRTSGG